MAGEQTNIAHRIVPIVLRTGLALSTSLIGVGLVIAMITGDRRLDGVTLGQAFTTATLDEKLVMFGIMALVATPIVEVAGLIVMWAMQRDWRFVGVGAAIAVILTIAAVIG